VRHRGEAHILEERRRLALELLQRGVTVEQVAQILSVTQRTIVRWRRLAREGPEALKIRKSPGRPRRLSFEAVPELAETLRQGPAALGLPGTKWTLQQVAGLIEQRFGIQYHPDHVSRLLRAADIDLEAINRQFPPQCS